YIRLGLRPEVHGPEERCPRTGAHKSCILGAVLEIFRLDYLSARHLEPFAPCGVQCHSRSDGGCDFQQLVELKPIGLRQPGNYEVGWLRGGPQRVLDVPHNLLNLEGRPPRHLPLQAPDPLDALTVPEEQLDSAT